MAIEHRRPRSLQTEDGHAKTDCRAAQSEADDVAHHRFDDDCAHHSLWHGELSRQRLDGLVVINPCAV